MEILKLLRLHQWLKNFFVFLPIFFGTQILNKESFLLTVLTFFAFSILSSSVYCLNDIMDVEMDRLHPEKRNRPIAKGTISIPVAYTTMCVLLATSLTTLICARLYAVLIISVIYYILNILYCLKLKHFPLIDIFIVSMGFVLRILAGGYSSNIKLSNWIVLMTFLISLFLALAKRLDDTRYYKEKNIKLRKNISRYNTEFIQLSLAIIASVTIVCYIMYTVDQNVIERISNNYLYTTSIFVMLGILRFLQLTVVDMKSSSPTKIMIRDRFIQLCILCWIIQFSIILYI